MWHFLRTTALVVLVGGTLAGCATSPNTAGRGGSPRSIVLVHPPSGEYVRTTYWRPADGYDARALFEIAELFRDRRTGDVERIDPELIDLLVELRENLGLEPETPIQVTSGYRSPITNASLARKNGNVAENSYHMRGQAADIYIPGVDPQRIADVAASLRRGGYAHYPHTGHVHVDTGPVRTWTPKGPGSQDRDRIVEARAAPAPPKPVRPTEYAEVTPPSRPSPRVETLKVPTLPSRPGKANVTTVRALVEKTDKPKPAPSRKPKK